MGARTAVCGTLEVIKKAPKGKSADQEGAAKEPKINKASGKAKKDVRQSAGKKEDKADKKPGAIKKKDKGNKGDGKKGAGKDSAKKKGNK